MGTLVMLGDPIGYLPSWNWSLILTAATAAVALLTLIYVVRLMNRQLEVMVRQLRLMEQQAELLARRAKLNLLVHVSSEGSTSGVMIQFQVSNDGNKAARDYYFQLFVPTTLHGIGNDFEMPEVQLPEGTYRRKAGYIMDPLYPTRRRTLGEILIAPDVEGSLLVQWLFVSEDGVFPGEGPGKTLVSLPRATLPKSAS